MRKEFVLSPEELYYLGGFKQAKFIDYAYVAAMDDIGHNLELFEGECKNSLLTKGLLSEDFSGNISVVPSLLSVLKPIFFGTSESAISICYIGSENGISINKFHFFDGMITAVSGKDGKLICKAVDLNEIREFVKKILPNDYSCDNTIHLSEIDTKRVSRFIVVKNTQVGVSSVVDTYIEIDGIIFRDKSSDLLESLTREEFVEIVLDVVRGDNDGI